MEVWRWVLRGRRPFALGVASFLEVDEVKSLWSLLHSETACQFSYVNRGRCRYAALTLPVDLAQNARQLMIK